jgi:dolichyl-phosphate-mannose-protein mannosyltransferase
MRTPPVVVSTEGREVSARRGRWLWVLLGVVIFAVGAGLRIGEIWERPFWRDEAWVAVAARDLSWAQVLTQTELPTPPLFLLVTKATGMVVSPPELGMRLMPLLCGIAIVPLIYAVGRSLRLPRCVAMVGMALAACSYVLTTWSREAKQYELEVFWSLLGAWCVARLACGGGGRRLAWLATGLCAICLVGPWAGYGVVFPLAALLVGLLLHPNGAPKRRRHNRATALLAMAILGASVGILLLVQAGGQAARGALQQEMARKFLDGTLHSWVRGGGKVLHLALGSLWPIADLQSRSSIAVTGAGILVVGALGLFVWPRRGRRIASVWLGGTLGLLLMAALLHRYPIVFRMMIWLAPPLILSVATALVVGLRYLILFLTDRTWIAFAVAMLLTVPLAARVATKVASKRLWVHHEFRPLLARVHQHPDARVLVSLLASPCVKYYAGDRKDWHFVPTVAATLPEPGFCYRSFVEQTLPGKGQSALLLTTSIERGLVSILSSTRGVHLSLEGETPGEPAYGCALLIRIWVE